MRKAHLLTILVCGFCFPAFSQSSVSPDIIQVQPKTSYRNNLLENIGKPFYFNDSLKFRALTDFSSLGKVANDQKPLVIKLPKIITHMPVFKPDGNYSVQIHKPDSTITYTLLTKEYQRR